ncbi:pentatricopeptide (PPR) repeat-containing protein [Rhynchospora pubera]|uniref:Pentatricopeptide (PPR) repeat-containing protein n=1 Tax=Rhynchospora pubera TaxID=906938 RepID=A0AAV8HV11_9POAL|nr:pentatricopeptide (PPR) repeat-containing protein [Rhynchospora pubera]
MQMQQRLRLLLPSESDPRALISLLVSLSTTRSLSQGEQLHAHLLKSGFIPCSHPSSPYTLLSNHFITFYSRCNLPLLSLRSFLSLPPPPSPSSWSSLLSSLSHHHHLSSLTLSYFRSMLLARVPPNHHSVPSVARVVGFLSDPSLARSLHGLSLKTPFATDVFVLTSVLDMYAKCSLLKEAQKVFDEMPERNVVSWSALICGYADAGWHSSVLHLFRSALHDGVEVNDCTFSSVIRVCAETTMLGLGALLHGLAIKFNLDLSPFVGSALVSLYSKCGILDSSYKVFNEMPEKNLSAWNSVLIASAQHGNIGTVFNLFEAMQAAGFQPNYVTFLCLLTACSHAGLLDEGKRYFSLMPVYGVEPGPEHYAAMADLLGRVGCISEALFFIQSMPIEPIESVWGALLTASRIHKDANTAAFAAQKLFEMGSRSPGMHMLLAGTYRAAGRHLEAAQARKAMRDSGLRKDAGLSWLEAGGVIHTFASGDQRHGRSVEIYRVLEEVGKRMEAAGYEPDTSGVHRNVRYHSERLAIGLGLLVVPEGVPIRVMKNIRVCNDCHTAIKYLTKCTGRVVVLRDLNRFHRFENGTCSCGDFW